MVLKSKRELKIQEVQFLHPPEEQTKKQNSLKYIDLAVFRGESRILNPPYKKKNQEMTNRLIRKKNLTYIN